MLDISDKLSVGLGVKTKPLAPTSTSPWRPSLWWRRPGLCPMRHSELGPQQARELWRHVKTHLFSFWMKNFQISEVEKTCYSRKIHQSHPGPFSAHESTVAGTPRDSLGSRDPRGLRRGPADAGHRRPRGDGEDGRLGRRRKARTTAMPMPWEDPKTKRIRNCGFPMFSLIVTPVLGFTTVLPFFFTLDVKKEDHGVRWGAAWAYFCRVRRGPVCRQVSIPMSAGC